MRHLQIYEKKFNINSLKKLASEKDELYELIKEYSIIHKLYNFKDGYNITNFYYEHNVEEWGDEVIIVNVADDNADYLLEPYIIYNLDDLNKFIENPKIYKDSIKYNI